MIHHISRLLIGGLHDDTSGHPLAVHIIPDGGGGGNYSSVVVVVVVVVVGGGGGGGGGRLELRIKIIIAGNVVASNES